jgi:ABC-type transport system involved in cytochrome bd biosynthesis fused ATPase/permease subunit
VEGVKTFAAVAFVIVSSITVLTIVRTVARWIERAGSAPKELPSDTQARLERVERALESVSIEIERISESQRFLTKILTERERPALGDGRGEDPAVPRGAAR